MQFVRWSLAGALTLGMISAASAQSLTKITIAVVPTVPSASTYIADAKGYLREAGVEADIQSIGSVSTVMPELATGRVQIAEGGLSAGYWNGLARGVSVIMALEGGSTPLNHELLLGLTMKDKIKTVADLRGHSVALNAPGSIIGYDLHKVLASAGMTLKDVELKYVPFPAMGAALANGAVDAAVEVPPFGELAVEKGLAAKWLDTDDYMKPTPVSIVHYVVNTEWADKNKALAHKIFIALARGTRDYCQAYHHGPNRDEVIGIMLKYGVAGTHATLDKYAWQARDPNGRFNMASLLDVQDWYYNAGYIKQKFTAQQLVDPSYADEAAKALGAFHVINKNDKLAGCR